MLNSSYYDCNRPELLPFLPQQFARVLELGCGAGGFSSGLKKTMAVEIWGVEPVAEAAALAASRLDKVLHKPVESAIPELPAQHFDLLICNDVLEHLVDPEATLRLLREKLTPNAKILVSLPNVRFLPVLLDLLVRRDWHYRESGVMDRTHLRFFTPKSARRMLEAAGFAVEREQGINSQADWRFHLFNLLTFGAFWDTQYLQFAIAGQVERRTAR